MDPDGWGADIGRMDVTGGTGAGVAGSPEFVTRGEAVNQFWTPHTARERMRRPDLSPSSDACRKAPAGVVKRCATAKGIRTIAAGSTQYAFARWYKGSETFSIGNVLSLIGEGQAEAAEELDAGGVAARSWILIADGGTTGEGRGKAERDQSAGTATEVEQQPATGSADVVDLDDLKAVAPLFVDVVNLHLFEDTQSRGVAFFRRHADSVWETDRLGSILPGEGCRIPN